MNVRVSRLSDDLFALYAAISIGPNAFLLSNDLFRDHVEKLENDAITRLFTTWMRSRVVRFNIDPFHYEVSGRDCVREILPGSGSALCDLGARQWLFLSRAGGHETRA